METKENWHLFDKDSSYRIRELHEINWEITEIAEAIKIIVHGIEEVITLKIRR